MIKVSRLKFPPSDRPAFELPDYEPIAADLAAIVSSNEAEISARLSSANILSAYEGHRRELARLRAELPAAALVTEPHDIDRGRVA